MKQVLLYGRDGCHLCEEARDALVEIYRSGIEFELVEIDIESDEALHKLLLERIPVVEIDGEQVCELGFEREPVLARLATFPA